MQAPSDATSYDNLSGIHGCSHIISRYKALPGASKQDSRSSDTGCEHVNVGLHDQQLGTLLKDSCARVITVSEWIY